MPLNYGITMVLEIYQDRSNGYIHDMLVSWMRDNRHNFVFYIYSFRKTDKIVSE